MRAEAEILVHPCHQVLAAHQDTRLAHFGALARSIVVSPEILDDGPLETLPYQRLEESFVSVFSALLLVPPRSGGREKEGGVTNNRIFFVTRNNRGKTSQLLFPRGGNRWIVKFQRLVEIVDETICDRNFLPTTSETSSFKKRFLKNDVSRVLNDKQL